MAPGLVNTCTCFVCRDVRRTIVDIFSVLDVYGWLVDSYIIDFFHQDLWAKLPGSWARTLENVEPEELGSWILAESGSQHVWPLSLLALRQLINKLSVNRHPDEKSALICRKSQLKHLLENSDGLKQERIFLKDKEATKFQNLFIKHVKKKKRYEIEKFSQHCSACARLTGCNCIVDTGAGMGHLARELAYKYHIPVICVEQDGTLSDMARKYDADFIRNLRKHLPDFCGQPPYHLCAKILEESCTGSQLVERFNEILTTNFSHLGESNDFGLIGLHPCGDLAARLLKFYVNQKPAKFISIVGCCYMKLTTSSVPERSLLGYPLSCFVSGIPRHSLTYEALEVACHAIENYCDKLIKNSYEDLKVHAFRATLETVLIQRKGSGVKHGRVGSVRVKDQMSFSQYCKLATEPLGPEKQLNESDINQIIVTSYLNRWKQVVIFEGLRIMLSPLVETLVLLDRFLYLSEHDLKPMLKAEFDPRLSPRNFVLTSTK